MRKAVIKPGTFYAMYQRFTKLPRSKIFKPKFSGMFIDKHEVFCQVLVPELHIRASTCSCEASTMLDKFGHYNAVLLGGKLRNAMQWKEVLQNLLLFDITSLRAGAGHPEKCCCMLSKSCQISPLGSLYPNTVIFVTYMYHVEFFCL